MRNTTKGYYIASSVVEVYRKNLKQILRMLGSNLCEFSTKCYCSRYLFYQDKPIMAKNFFGQLYILNRMIDEHPSDEGYKAYSRKLYKEIEDAYWNSTKIIEENMLKRGDRYFRDFEIYRIYKEAGLSYHKLGEEYGLTGQRIKQICDKIEALMKCAE